MPSIQYDKWALLSAPELELLKNMGFTLEKEKLPGEKTTAKAKLPVLGKEVFALEEYVLIMHITCRLCGTTHTEMFHMIRTDDHRGLTKKTITDEIPGLQNRLTKRTVQLCPYCEGKLSTLGTEELVTKLIATTRELHGIVGVEKIARELPVEPLNHYRDREYIAPPREEKEGETNVKVK